MQISGAVLDELTKMEKNNQPHYRILYRLGTKETFVACLQYHDYFDYKDCGFVNATRYATEAEAEDARVVSHFYGEDAGE